MKNEYPLCWMCRTGLLSEMRIFWRINFNSKYEFQMYQHTCFEAMVVLFQLSKLDFSIVESLDNKSGFTFRCISLDTVKIFNMISFAFQQKWKLLKICIVSMAFYDTRFIRYSSSTFNRTWNESKNIFTFFLNFFSNNFNKRKSLLKTIFLFISSFVLRFILKFRNSF